MARDRIEWDHDALEAALDDFFPECMEVAEKAKSYADSMRSRPGIAEYNVREATGPSSRYGHSGGRKFAVVSADAPSTIADEGRTNALNKAAGSC